MGDSGKRDIDILREKIGNRGSPLISTSSLVAMNSPDDKTVRKEQPDTMSTSEYSAEMETESLFDDDTDSEYGGPVAPSQKRKRRTNNSLALELDDGSSEILVPPPPKRSQINHVGKESSVLIGVWKDSPPSDPAKKHAVYSFIDIGDSLRRKIHPETRDGEPFTDGYPTGTGRTFVTPESVILEPHLSSLSRQELKEYVRLRSSSRQDESPEERLNADLHAVQEAKEIAAKIVPVQTAGASPNISSTQSKLAKPSTPSTPKGGIPNGVYLGFWKDSDAKEDADKHAVFGVVDSNRLRVKVIKFTPDGRPYQGNFPTNPGSNWIPFDDVVREPTLAKLKRLEVIEYVRLRQNSKQQGRSDIGYFEVDPDTIQQAIEILAMKAKSLGVTPDKLDAENEASRKAHNESRAALKAKDGVGAKGWKYYENTRSSVNGGNLHTKDAEAKGTEAATARQSEVAAAEGTGSPKPRETQLTPAKESDVAKVRESPSVANVSKNQHPDPKSNASEAMARLLRTDLSDGRAKAIRSSKAEADARAEKLRKLREAAAKNKEATKGDGAAKGVVVENDSPSARDGLETREATKERPTRTTQELARQAEAKQNITRDESRQMEQARTSAAQRLEEAAKQKESRRLRELAKEKAEAEEKEKRAKQREAAHARAEMEKAKADAIETISNEFFNTDSLKERTKATSEESNQVINSPAYNTTSLNRTHAFSDVKSHNNLRYIRKETGPFAGKLVCEKRELLTIDGEDYVEYRILMRTEF